MQHKSLDQLAKANGSMVDAVQRFWRYYFDRLDRLERQAQESDQLLIAEIMRAQCRELENLEKIDQAFQAGLKRGMEIGARYAALLSALLASIVVGTLVLSGLLWLNWDRLCAPPLNNTQITTTHISGGKL